MRKLLLFFFLAAQIFAQAGSAAHTFKIGEQSFLIDNKPIVIRCGEMHFARIPREYWQHRLQMAKAMGLNTVCAYLFWNYHEPAPDQFNWKGMADVAEFCKLAQKEGLLVILRPGPYSCAEWELGGQPWWLLKKEDIKLRTQDPYYLERSRKYLKEVGRVLAPLQIVKGGPIIMVQVENEYGSFGNDKTYIGIIRDYLKEAGFTVPFFTCDGPVQLKNDVRDDIFPVVNFGSNPEGSFKYLREVLPTGPLMCGEYYPGWFDSWSRKHHIGGTANIIKELGWMLDHKASFSIYMVHGGSTFGWWAGANCPPFLPEVSSYDYDAPISEAGWETPKFLALRELFTKYLDKGETLPNIPKRNKVISVPEIKFTQFSSLFGNQGKPVKSVRPQNMEKLNQGYGCILYRKKIPAGPAASLNIKEVHDYALVYLDGKKIATLDRIKNQNMCTLPSRDKEMTLDIFIEPMGRVNYGNAMHDRKGISEKVELIEEGKTTDLLNWEIFLYPYFEKFPGDIKFSKNRAEYPSYYKSSFKLNETGDFFLDVSKFGKGMVWINDHCLGRYWNIGPTQTMYVPAPWLKKGSNQIVILDLQNEGGTTVRGLKEPVLDSLRNNSSTSKNKKLGQKLILENAKPVHQGTFPEGKDWQTVKFDPVNGRYFCLEAINALNGQPFASCAEIYLIDENGNNISRDNWKVLYADSEEISGDDGKADNLFDLQFTTFWHTEWEAAAPAYPHSVVIDLGRSFKVAGIKYLPRQDSPNGRIKDYKLYLSEKVFQGI